MVKPDVCTFNRWHCGSTMPCYCCAEESAHFCLKYYYCTNRSFVVICFWWPLASRDSPTLRIGPKTQTKNKWVLVFSFHVMQFDVMLLLYPSANANGTKNAVTVAACATSYMCHSSTTPIHGWPRPPPPLHNVCAKQQSLRRHRAV